MNDKLGIYLTIIDQHYLAIGSVENKIALLHWPKEKSYTKVISRLNRHFNISYSTHPNQIQQNTIKQLHLYFVGKLRDFNIPPIVTGTDLQIAVWKMLNNIKYGSVTSYKEIAKELNRENSVRAVANAISINPINLIIPCHRVIGSDGSITVNASGGTTPGRTGSGE